MKLYAIGVGTGNSEDVTMRAVRAIAESDYLFVPVKEAGEESFAYEIIKPYVQAHTQIIELVFPMVHDKKVLQAYWKTNAAQIHDYLSKAENGTGAFIVIGDVTLYSTYMYMDQDIKASGIEVECVPGITSYIGAAAVVGQPLALLDEKVAIVPARRRGTAELSDIMDQFETVVIMKPSQDSEHILNVLREKSYEKHFRLVYKVGTEEQKVYDNIDDIEGKTPYLSVLIVKKGGFYE